MARKVIVFWMLLMAMPAFAQHSLTKTYVSVDCSLRFDYPGNWVVEGTDSGARLGSHQAILDDGPGQLAADDVLITVMGSTIDDLKDNLETLGSGIMLLEVSNVLVVDATSDVEIVQAPTVINSESGLEGILLVSQRDDVETLTMIIWIDSDRVLIASAATALDGSRQYEPLILAIVESVRISMPSPNPVAKIETPASGETLRQWARCATASSEYTSFNWSAMQATGAPDTDSCGDITTAWASESSTGTDTLTLEFAQAVVPTQINIYQTYNPGSITEVEVIITDGNATISLPNSADPPGNTSCPGVFTIDVTEPMPDVHGIIIHLDQTIGGSWNEIDAVELVGRIR